MDCVGQPLASLCEWTHPVIISSSHPFHSFLDNIRSWRTWRYIQWLSSQSCFIWATRHKVQTPASSRIWRSAASSASQGARLWSKAGLDVSVSLEKTTRAICWIILNYFRSRSINGNQTILEISVADSVESDLYSSFERICSFIGKCSPSQRWFGLQFTVRAMHCIPVHPSFIFRLTRQRWFTSPDSFPSGPKPLQRCHHRLSHAPPQILTGGRWSGSVA